MSTPTPVAVTQTPTPAAEAAAAPPPPISAAAPAPSSPASPSAESANAPPAAAGRPPSSLRVKRTLTSSSGGGVGGAALPKKGFLVTKKTGALSREGTKASLFYSGGGRTGGGNGNGNNNTGSGNGAAADDDYQYSGEAAAQRRARLERLLAAFQATQKKSRLISLLATFVVLAIVSTSIVVFVIYAPNEPSANLNYFPNPDVAAAKQDGVILNIKTTGADFLSNRVQYNVRVYPAGKYISNKELMVSNTPISVVMDNIERKFWTEPGLVSTQTQSNPYDMMIVATGTFLMYPFDKHTNTFSITAYERNDTTATVPIIFQFKNIAETYAVSVEPKFTNTTTYASMSVSVTLARTSAAHIFSIFAALLMWILGLAVFRFALDAMSDNSKQIEGPVMGVCIAMLFALPALRNTQPNIPPIGVLSDVFAFFWAELSIIFTALTQMILYTIRKKKEGQRIARQLEEGLLKKQATAGSSSAKNKEKKSPSSTSKSAAAAAAVTTTAAVAVVAGAGAALAASTTTTQPTAAAADDADLDEEELDDANAANAMDVWGDAGSSAAVAGDPSGGMDLGGDFGGGMM